MIHQYDVFLSCKNLSQDGTPTPDSLLAQELYEFLSGRGLSVFYSNRSLERLGISAYKRCIDDALDSAQILVAIATSAENLESQWVRYEWDSFINDILSGGKPEGRVFVFVHNVEVATMPRALRQSQTFQHGPGSIERLYNFIVNGLTSHGPGSSGPLPASRETRNAPALSTQQQLLIDNSYPQNIVDDLYLVHEAEVVRPRTDTRTGRFRVRVTLEAMREELLDEVERVTYKLHPTFRRQIITTVARKLQFQLELQVFGEFTIVAVIDRKGKEPLWLTRYLNLPGRPPD